MTRDEAALSMVLRNAYWMLDAIAHDVRRYSVGQLEDAAEMLTSVARLLRERAGVRTEPQPPTETVGG